MLLIRTIEVKNFACFEHLELNPSRDPKRPLTVIRAENGSGKTTLLRAIRWGMYGEKALGGRAHEFSLHPATWQPDAKGKTTSVSIEFETDGSSREHLQGAATHSAFILNRWVRTVAAPSPAGQPDAPDFRRIEEQVSLQKRQPNGSWKKHEAGVGVVVGELLPWELRDFFVMDADEAADYVGGSENKMVDRRDVVNKTTHAVNALLGLEIFEDTKASLNKISNEFRREAARATGDQTLVAKQDERDECRKAREELQAEIDARLEAAADIQDRLNAARSELETLVGSIEAHVQLKLRLAENEKAQGKAAKDRKEALDALGASALNIVLLSSLAASEVASVRQRLQPLYDDGSIPVRHLEFVRMLVERRECVCGQALDASSEFGQRVREALARSSEQKERADWLSNVLDAANALHGHGGRERWDQNCAHREEAFAEVEHEIHALDLIKRDIESELDGVDDQAVQTKRSEITMLETQHDSLQRELGAQEVRAEALDERLHELEGVVRGGRARAREAQEHQASQQLADLLVSILDGAYTAIQRDQVGELDREMNRLFRKMADNVTDDEPVEGSQRKATLAMIARVGLRPLAEDAEKYEIFALNSRGRTMPPTEINGASRRILALSFVLALCRESQTNAPLVADSLLNFMSGSVRTNTLRVTAQTASQPILLLTGSDLESDQDAELVSRYAGATYTLTGQWQHSSESGDVVNMTDPRKVSLLCSCGPRQFCSVCEREGQAGRAGWSRRRVHEGSES